MSQYKELLEKELSRFVSPSSGLLSKRKSIRRDCPVCGAKYERLEFLFTKRGFSFVLCRSCGLMFSNPMPREDLAMGLYRLSDSIQEWARIMNCASQREFDLRLYNALYSLFTKHLSLVPRKILDISMRGGIVSESKDYQKSHIDFFDFAHATCKCGERRYSNACFYDELLSVPSGYDVVISMEAMEHFYHPLSFLKNVYRILSEEGIFCGVFSNVDSLAVRILQSQAPLFDGLYQKFFFNKVSLTNLLNRGGFSLVDWITMVDGDGMIKNYLERWDVQQGLYREVIKQECFKNNGYKFLFIAKKFKK